MSERAPTVLLPYQQAWIADKSAVKICEKGRRVGLSWAEAADDALTAAASTDAGGDDTWYIGYNQDMAKEFIRDIAFWAKHYQLAAGEMEESVFKDEDKDILAFVINFASGFRVTALSSRPSNLRGKQGRVVIDEAAFHGDLAGLIKAAMALLMWGGKVRIISTHDGDTNPFNELVLDCRAKKVPYSLHRIEFKSAVEQGLFRRICLATHKTWSPEAEEEWVAAIYAFYGDDAREELDVVPGSGSGTYLTRQLIESCMSQDIPVVRLCMPDTFTLMPGRLREAEINDWCCDTLIPLLSKLDPNLDHYFGEDFARSGDLSAIWPLEQTRTLGLVSPFVLELRNIPFEQQKQILFYLVDRLPRFRAGALDARGNGQYLAEVAMQRYGSGRIAQVMLSQEWYRENMPPLKAAFEDKTLLIPRDADILGDMRAIKLENGVAKVPDKAHTRGSDGRDRHGDTAVALAMATYAVFRMEPAGGACTGFQSVARRGSADHRADDFNSRSRGML